MKRKNTLLAAIVLSAFFVIVCFAVRYEQNQEYEERLDYAKAVWETSVRVQPESLYCRQPGGDFADAEAGSKSSANTENLWVKYEPNLKDLEELSEIDKYLIEKLSKQSIRDSEGVTKEEFVTEIERWGSFYNAPFFSENAELLFDIAQEESYNEYFYPMLAMVQTNGGRYVNGEFNSCNLIERIEKEDDKETVKPSWRNFESDEECIREFFRILDGKPYESVTTLTEFTAIWAPNTEEHPCQAEQYAIKMWLSRERVKDFL